MALKPRYKVATPREDLREGKPLDASEFAVHLDQIRDGRAPGDYQNPRQFFERTYLTANLTSLAADCSVLFPHRPRQKFEIRFARPAELVNAVDKIFRAHLSLRKFRCDHEILPLQIFRKLMLRVVLFGHATQRFAGHFEGCPECPVANRLLPLVGMLGDGISDLAAQRGLGMPEPETEEARPELKMEIDAGRGLFAGLVMKEGRGVCFVWFFRA